MGCDNHQLPHHWVRRYLQWIRRCGVYIQNPDKPWMG
jgi:hypothetical protein